MAVGQTEPMADLQKNSLVATGSGTAAIMISEPAFTQRFAYDASGLVLYQGYAKPGTLDAGATWAIKKNTIVGTQVTEVKWAGGAMSFDKQWTERATYTYA